MWLFIFGLYLSDYFLIWFVLLWDSKGNQPWIFIGWTDPEAQAPVLWPPDAKSQHIGKDSDAGNNWRQEEKGITEDEMIGWHHRLNEQEFEQAPADVEGQGSLLCCSPWGCKKLGLTEWLNNSNKKGPVVSHVTSLKLKSVVGHYLLFPSNEEASVSRSKYSF